MNNLILIIAIILLPVALGAGIAIGYLYKQNKVEKDRAEKRDEAEKVLKEAVEKAQQIEIKARDEALEIHQKAEVDLVRRRADITREEERLGKRREELDLRLDRLEKREQALNKRQSLMDKRSNDLDKMYSQQLEELQRVANLSEDEARTLLLAEIEKTARSDMARIIRQVEMEAREEGETRARKIIIAAIQRVASEQVAENTTSTVVIPSDEMKGRIIGRNGRNIHAFEQAAGVDVIVDDTPEAVTISCFDPVRREVARRSLAKLIQDGRIHPAHIEKILKNEQKEVDRSIVEAGEQAVYEAGVPGLHPEIVRTLGRLKYRTSYGQNQLSHAVETAKIAAMIAAEVGADIEVSRAGALLHDLGKALDYNIEGTHAQNRGRPVQALWRQPESHQRHRLPPPRDRARNGRGCHRGDGGCHLRRPSRGAPRKPGAVHQARALPGRHRQFARGRYPELCPAGRARGAHFRAPGRNRRLRRRAPGERRRP